MPLQPFLALLLENSKRSGPSKAVDTAGVVMAVAVDMVTDVVAAEIVADGAVEARNLLPKILVVRTLGSCFFGPDNLISICFL